MKKTFLILSIVLCAMLAAAQTNFHPPTVSVSNGTTGIKWNAGTVNNGGHPVTVAAGTSTVTLNKADCSSPSFANCNFVFVNSTGTVSVTTTLATAIASGNSLIALIETGAVTTTQVVYPWQSGTMWLQAAGPSTNLTTPVLTTPTIAAGLLASGSASNDFSGSTGTFKTSTGAVTIGPGAISLSGIPTFTAGLLASGAVSNDFSGSTGTFKTSTGVNTFGGSSNSFSGAVTITPTSSLTLGTSGSAVGQLIFNNGTSGTITIQPPTGALGSLTHTLPINTGGYPVVNSCGSTGSGNQTCSIAAATGKTQVYVGSSTLAANSAIITFPNAYTSATSYFCVANDVTTRANPVQMVPTNTITATITNTTGATDVVQWMCVGN